MHKILGDAFRIDYRSCNPTTHTNRTSETRKTTQSWVDWLGKTAVDFFSISFMKIYTNTIVLSSFRYSKKRKKMSLGRSIHHRRLVGGGGGINFKPLLCVCVCCSQLFEELMETSCAIAPVSPSYFIHLSRMETGRQDLHLYSQLPRSRFTLYIY